MGAKWRVGDEKSIGVYNDSWIPGLPSGRVASSFSGLGREIGVVELINQATGSWHVNLMENSIFPFEAQQILAIPLCASQQSNFFYWSLEKNGIYSVKSGYKILCDEARSEEALGSNRNGGQVCGLVFGNLRYQVRLNIFCGRHPPIVYQLRQTY